ncbi:pyridoxal phosphate-dependent decarboxylase family protein [Ensifer sp. MJa1]|uniref:pyridoxal phosphate-dependent decarboxylase family protein n=1 Tax=Ensifer sp. MJa1 TaxID=2919888 RepID=UPI0030085D57
MHTLPEKPDAVEETLDPQDWDELRALSHRIVDEAIDYVSGVRERPVWRNMPAAVRETLVAPLPKTGKPLAEIYASVVENVLGYPMGNIHPRFWAWYMGAGNFTGALGEFLAAVQGSNVGGGNHAAALMDQQVVNWCKEMLGFPASASGSLVSGGSVANILGLTVARNAKAGVDLRERGVAALKQPLCFYGSDQIHSCHRKGVEVLGLGNEALRRISTDSELRIDVAALRRAIEDDRASGRLPVCIIANAGTVNTGAIDDLQALADLAAEQHLWLHVDGCIGALLKLAPENRWRVAGIEKADSIALDPHKWLHAPFEAGCVLVRDAATHRGTFAVTPEYLESSTRGLASAPWLFDYGLQTSRGFRALKIWMALMEHGVEKFGRLIDQNIAQGHYLSDLIEAEPLLELVAPTNINIVCFRFRPKGVETDELKAINIEIMLQLQDEGTAMISDTTVHGEHCLRVAVNNHRTRREDLKLFVEEVVRLGCAIARA